MSVCSIEYDVNADCWITTAAPSVPDARAAWRQVVGTVAERVRAALPECNGRVESVVKIVLAGDVELLPDGTATLASQSEPETVCAVHGMCQCLEDDYGVPRACPGREERGAWLRTLMTLCGGTTR